VRRMIRLNVIIDENYEGLKDDGWCFRLSGDLIVEGSLEIKLGKWLVVEKSIKAGTVSRQACSLCANSP
jgi:hypothetical protein